MTAHDDAKSEIRALDAGAVDCVSKPVNGPVVRALNQTFMEPYGADRQPQGAPLPAPDNVLAPANAGARMCFAWREAEPALREAAREAQIG